MIRFWGWVMSVGGGLMLVVCLLLAGTRQDDQPILWLLYGAGEYAQAGYDLHLLALPYQHDSKTLVTGVFCAHVSPNGEWLWYTQSGFPSTPAYLMNWRTQQRLELTYALDCGVQWSPDSHWIAYLDDQNNLHTYQIPTQQHYQLFTTTGYYNLPQWLLDSQHLAFIHTLPNQVDLYRIQANLTEPKFLWQTDINAGIEQYVVQRDSLAVQTYNKESIRIQLETGELQNGFQSPSIQRMIEYFYQNPNLSTDPVSPVPIYPFVRIHPLGNYHSSHILWLNSFQWSHYSIRKMDCLAYHLTPTHEEVIFMDGVLFSNLSRLLPNRPRPEVMVDEGAEYHCLWAIPDGTGLLTQDTSMPDSALYTMNWEGNDYQKITSEAGVEFLLGWYNQPPQPWQPQRLALLAIFLSTTGLALLYHPQ